MRARHKMPVISTKAGIILFQEPMIYRRIHARKMKIQKFQIKDNSLLCFCNSIEAAIREFRSKKKTK